MILTDIDYIQPTRNFSLAYVILDSIFVIFFVSFLFFRKKYVTGIFSLIGGILYFLVDFLIFYLALGSRVIYISSSDVFNTADAFITCMILLWMSLSYGILDFAFIWLWLSYDKKALQYTFLIVIWWICCPLIASFIDNLCPNMIYIMTTRSTMKYHGVMGIIMVVGYFFLIIKDILYKEKIPLVRLFVIGFMAQFLWEFILFIFNIRSLNYSDDFIRVISTMLQDSLVETNLGMPYLYLINKAVSKRFKDCDSLVDEKCDNREDIRK